EESANTCARQSARTIPPALKALCAEFPDVSLVIAGEPPAARWRDVKKAVGYPAYLARLISAEGLGEKVRYTGVLDAGGMVRALCRAHVFALSSLIENSPNTLGEAMILGRPCVCAFAGGAPDMAAPDSEALFYRPEDPIAMAHQIGRIFRSDDFAASLGRAAAHRAAINHDRRANRDRLMATYAQIAPSGGARFAA
ncbi:MAG: glycosyltransferase, partial [Pseudomonadota bacterium]